MCYNWSSQNPKKIKWAAFFSDCEHEVGELTSGHRVTLTYNLYTASASLPKPMKSIEVESLPLYWEVKAALQNKQFLTEGGIIGFFCNHFYAQSYMHKKATQMQSQALKGVDMMIYAVCRSLRPDVVIRPVMNRTYYVSDEEEVEEFTFDGEIEHDDGTITQTAEI